MSPPILGFQYRGRRARAGCYAEFGQVAVKRCVAREISDGSETRPREDLAQTSQCARITDRGHFTPFAPNPMDPMRAPYPIPCIHSWGPGQISRNGPPPAKLGRASARPNLAEWSERMRAERSPRIAQSYTASN